jgi:TolB-like protein
MRALVVIGALLCALPYGRDVQAAGQNTGQNTGQIDGQITDQNHDQPRLVLEGVIAVVPFISRSSDPDHQWIGAGIAAGVSTDLSQLGLTLLGQDTVSGVLTNLGGTAAPFDVGADDDPAFRQAFQERGAAWLVVGAVQHVGPLVRITARVVDVGTGEVVHSVRADGTMRDLFGAEDQIAAAVAEPFGLAIPGAAPPSR